MKVKVIGSGSMWNEYNSASYMIDNDILVDMPNGMCKYLYRFNINPMNIKNVLITHFHGDHYFDLPFFYLNKTRAKDRIINVFCSKKGPKKIRKLLKLAFPNSVMNIENEISINYNFNEEFKVNDYMVSKLLVDHGRLKPAYGYIFKNGDLSVGFTGDSTICDGVEYMASVCNYLFCDCMFVTGTDKHMGINHIKSLAIKNPNCIFVLSHMENVTREEIKRLKIKNVIAPDDGEEFTIK